MNREVDPVIDKLKDKNVAFLFEAILNLKHVEECYKFFDDLCTVTELRALSQRLAVAKMLSEHRVYSEIVETTGASTATISRVNRSLNYGLSLIHILSGRMTVPPRERRGATLKRHRRRRTLAPYLLSLIHI